MAKSRTRLSNFTFNFHFSLLCIGEGNGNPLQGSCLENPRDRGAWWAAVYGVTQSRTRLMQLSSSRAKRVLGVSPGGISGKESTCQYRRQKRCKFNPWIRKIPWNRKWHSTSVFLPGKSHGQRSLLGYSPWGHKRVGNDLAAKTTRASPIGQSAVQMHQDVPVGL